MWFCFCIHFLKNWPTKTPTSLHFLPQTQVGAKRNPKPRQGQLQASAFRRDFADKTLLLLGLFSIVVLPETVILAFGEDLERDFVGHKLDTVSCGQSHPNADAADATWSSLLVELTIDWLEALHRRCISPGFGRICIVRRSSQIVLYNFAGCEQNPYSYSSLCSLVSTAIGTAM